MKNATGQTQQMRNLFQEALLPVTDHQAKIKRKQFKPDYARFKCKFWYRDGNYSVHYSYDFQPRYTNGIRRMETDEELGMAKLRNMILKAKQDDTYITAVIWANVTNDTNTDTGSYDVEVFKHIRKSETAKVNRLVIFRAGKLELNPLINSIKKQI